MRGYLALFLHIFTSVKCPCQMKIICLPVQVMRVIIFDLFGNILQKFSCSKHLEFPNGVVVNDQEEIFISDNRAHCVKVFNYQGQSEYLISSRFQFDFLLGVSELYAAVENRKMMILQNPLFWQSAGACFNCSVEPADLP